MDKISAKELIASYDDHYRQAGRLRESDAFYRWILRKLGARAGTKLLDVAGGEGHMARLAARQGLAAVSVDFSTIAAAIAGRSPAGSLAGDGQLLPFAAGTFDYVTNIGSLEHFLDPRAGLREMRRVLRPEGRAAIFLPNSFYLLDIIWHVWRTGYGVSHKQLLERFATKNEWRDLLESEGFRTLAIYPYNRAWPTTPADFAWYRRHPRKLAYLLLGPITPTNLAYSFLFIATIL
jgi:ubiquinone/menaquinone biosynthesis C-methylase UbiE